MANQVKKSVKAGSGYILLLLFIFAACFFGFGRLKCYTVLSGSMEPEYPTGCLIFVKPAGKQNLKEGDVITFRRGDMIVTHRITEVFTKENNSSEVLFRTKGDANDTEDEGIVKREDVIGVPVWKIPGLGYAVIFFQNLVLRLFESLHTFLT
ncbi:MAG: signal peptidase I [Blautia sp.]|nr:signal peptidase I [Blautia sp.]MDY5031854.1 signal peptidase I [Blautia sp.]